MNSDQSSTNMCSVCVMDDTANDFVSFGSEGCNYCVEFKKTLELDGLWDKTDRQDQLEKYLG